MQRDNDTCRLPAPSQDRGKAEMLMWLPNRPIFLFYKINKRIIKMIASTNELVDIETISIDTNLSMSERVASFLKQIKNPYRFTCKGVSVTVSFNKNGGTLEDNLKEYYKSKVI
jgi:hypothetical protein